SELVRIFGELHKTVVVVTHDVREAFVFGSVITLLSRGRIVQQGTLADLAQRPADPFVSEFLSAQAPPAGMTLDLGRWGGGRRCAPSAALRSWSCSPPRRQRRSGRPSASARSRSRKATSSLRSSPRSSTRPARLGRSDGWASAARVSRGARSPAARSTTIPRTP